MPAHVAIACGGTGGHFFPGVSVARELQQQGAEVTLLVSEKPVDQQAVATVPDIPHEVIPSIGFTARHPIRFLRGLRAGTQAARKIFKANPPDAVLAMGGFTAAAPIWVGRQLGAATFLHESNAIPGRANRLLARIVNEVFVGFEEAGRRLNRPVVHTGTPVREAFRPGEPIDDPLLLVTGGSQGAQAINRLVIEADLNGLQILHLTGESDFIKIKKAYANHTPPAEVQAFCQDMPAALSRASLVVARAGASSLAELAAAHLPAILIPLPNSTDDHQRANARVAEAKGGAVVLEQEETAPADLAKLLRDILNDPPRLTRMGSAMGELHQPQAAQNICRRILGRLG